MKPIRLIKEIFKEIQNLKYPVYFFIACIIVVAIFGNIVFWDYDYLINKFLNLVLFIFIFGYVLKYLLEDLEKLKKKDLEKNKNMPEIKSTKFYKRGVFVLVKRLPSGTDSYITFKYKSKAAQTITSGFHLAIFNELQFANWYLGSHKKELKKNIPTDGQFLILEILDQSRWDFVRRTVFINDDTKNAILNPCEGNKNHRCPMVIINFNEYADFNKLKKSFAKHPNKHFELEE